MRLFLAFVISLGLVAQDAPPYKPSETELAAIRQKMAALDDALKGVSGEYAADVQIYRKAGEWILRHPEEFLTKAYYDNTLKVLDAGAARAGEAKSGKPSWVGKKGRVALAYVSRVDGSVQPYAVIVPESYDGVKPIRLDVVLHGRNARLNEVSFLADAEWGRPVTPQRDRIELHVYGRTNNAYRWAGETDVFEALAAVQKRFKIDENRIVLRGFSMGGAGTWHIGLQYPDRWAAIEAGAGFSDTKVYAKIESAPEYQERPWTIYDGYLYARNVGLVPTVGYGSIDDPQLRASTLVKEQLAKEGLPGNEVRVLFLIGPRIGHKFAPESKAESEAFIQKALADGRTTPERIRFVTYTTRYSRCFWVNVEGLERHYDRAEIDARKAGSLVRIGEAKNINRLSFASKVNVDVEGKTIAGVTEIEKVNGAWRAAKASKQLRKRPGLQGPIDDAFANSFLVVRPSGNGPKLALDRMEEFRRNFDKFLRGDIRVKDDRSVSDEDIRNHNLVLFGDASSNKLIARIQGKLPKKQVGKDQLLVMVYPNPLNPSKYVVLNSGHTFGDKEFRGTNALLYPRLGDWAILDGQGGVVSAGIFNENWE